MSQGWWSHHSYPPADGPKYVTAYTLAFYPLIRLIDLINFLCFQAFLLYIHFMRENVRLYTKYRKDDANQM